MRRNTHIFQFTGSDIATSAAYEAEYHGARNVYWTKQYERALNEARQAFGDPTISLERIAASPNLNTGDVGKRLIEAHTKMIIHGARSEDLARHAIIYRTVPDQVFALDAEDVIYFRLAEQPREE